MKHSSITVSLRSLMTLSVDSIHTARTIWRANRCALVTVGESCAVFLQKASFLFIPVSLSGCVNHTVIEDLCNGLKFRGQEIHVPPLCCLQNPVACVHMLCTLHVYDSCFCLHQYVKTKMSFHASDQLAVPIAIQSMFSPLPD